VDVLPVKNAACPSKMVFAQAAKNPPKTASANLQNQKNNFDLKFFLIDRKLPAN
jgi:hypothetical protein